MEVRGHNQVITIREWSHLSAKSTFPNNMLLFLTTEVASSCPLDYRILKRILRRVNTE
ncbi:hypothetical protein Bca4012_044337 [Brassica carinata]